MTYNGLDRLSSVVMHSFTTRACHKAKQGGHDLYKVVYCVAALSNPDSLFPTQVQSETPVSPSETHKVITVSEDTEAANNGSLDEFSSDPVVSAEKTAELKSREGT